MPVALVVEDHLDLLEFNSLALEMAGWTVARASSADAAYTLAMQHRPDLLVTDLAMPGCDGLQLAARLRQHFRDKHLPVILVTGEPARLQELPTRELPACEVLVKPVGLEVLQHIAGERIRLCELGCCGAKPCAVLPDYRAHGCGLIPVRRSTK